MLARCLLFSQTIATPVVVTSHKTCKNKGMTKPHTTGCKICGETTKRLRRGLCSTHYGRFTTKVKSLPADEAAAFEAKCLADGWIEESKQGRRPKIDDDPFDDLVAEVRAEFAHDIEAAEQRLDAKAKTTKPTKKRKAE